MTNPPRPLPARPRFIRWLMLLGSLFNSLKGHAAPPDPFMKIEKQLELKVSLMPAKENRDARYPERRPWVAMTLENAGPLVIYFSRDSMQRSREVWVKDSAGRQLTPKPALAESAALPPGVSNRRMVALAPGEKETIEFALGDFFDLSETETYVLDVAWTVPLFRSAEDFPQWNTFEPNPKVVQLKAHLQNVSIPK